MFVSTDEGDPMPGRRSSYRHAAIEPTTAVDPEIAHDSDPFTRRRVLEQRLDDGYRRIEEARLNQLDVRAWEDFWIQLLREYERVCDELGSLAA